MANAKKKVVVEQKNFSKTDIEMIKYGTEKLGAGIKFLCELRAKVGETTRAQFIALAGEHPEVATRLISYWENVEAKAMDTQVAMNQATCALVGKMVDGTCQVLNTLASKTDVTAIVLKLAELEQAKRYAPLSERDRVWKLQEENRAKELELEAQREARRAAAAEKNGTRSTLERKWTEDRVES